MPTTVVPVSTLCVAQLEMVAAELVQSTGRAQKLRTESIGIVAQGSCWMNSDFNKSLLILITSWFRKARSFLCCWTHFEPLTFKPKVRYRRLEPSAQQLEQWSIWCSLQQWKYSSKYAESLHCTMHSFAHVLSFFGNGRHFSTCTPDICGIFSVCS